jgi:hypothetical protein
MFLQDRVTILKTELLPYPALIAPFLLAGSVNDTPVFRGEWASLFIRLGFLSQRNQVAKCPVLLQNQSILL